MQPMAPASPSHPRTLLVFSQTFVPDPASVGQHMADVAIEMARRGYRVLVYTANRGYDDPSVRYPAREELQGVHIRRLPLSSFGKRSIFTRLIGTVSFMAQVLLLALCRRGDGIFFSTSPPMIGLVISLARILRCRPAAYWAMDLNPDQLLALGKIKPGGLLARLLEAVNRFILRRATLVIALDRFMAARLEARAPMGERLVVIPPWPHEECLGDAPEPAENPFRREHGLTGRFVVMYSGNHSPSNPLDTLLEAAERLRDDPRLMFVFVGGGVGKKRVEQFVQDHALPNALCLPYQPQRALGQSLTAADVHVVALGAAMAGIIHPCKVYGAMAVGRPILYLGPRPSHISDLLEQHTLGFHIEHGDVAGTVELLRTLPDHPNLADMGRHARQVLREQLSQELLRGRLCDHLERMLG
jgi:colanic acid biosynthesis glycosyl transferase WcaI